MSTDHKRFHKRKMSGDGDCGGFKSMRVINKSNRSNHANEDAIASSSASVQKVHKGSRSPLSANSQSRDTQRYQWDPSCEVQFVQLQEELEWLINNHKEPFSACDPDQIQIDSLPFDLSSKTEFVDKTVLTGLIEAKNRLEELPKEQLQRARLACNPFESISKSIFQNRAALKMANLDAICEHVFTAPPKSEELLHFVDLCAGPGGFSEYILWRRKWEARGIGFTLRNENDFKLDAINSNSVQSQFEPFYGKMGDGNIYHPHNLLSIRELVLERTEGRGAHLVMADGGFSVAGNELQQEHLLKRLYLCQFLCALGVLRPGGHFLCKVFDIFSETSISLIYLMYRCFEQFAIVKPNTSRPANSERFVLFKYRRAEVSAVKDFLFNVNCQLDHAEAQGPPVGRLQQLIPMNLVRCDTRFSKYIKSSNTRIGRRQIHFLWKMNAFANDANLYEPKKNDLRRRCLDMWKVPLRPEPPKTLELSIKALLKRDHAVFYYPAKQLAYSHLQQIRFPWNYKFTTLGEDRDGKGIRGFFFVDKCTQLLNFSEGQWKPLPAGQWISLPAFTLLYGELSSELKGEAAGQKKTAAFHVLDALILGDVQVWQRSLEERIAMIEKLLLACNNTNRNAPSSGAGAALPVRLKKYFNLAQLEQFYTQLEMRECKGKRKERLCQKIEGEQFAIVSGLHICNTLKTSWACRFSQSGGKLYYFNYKKKMDSIYKCPTEARTDFVGDFSERFEWTWEDSMDLLTPPDECEDSSPPSPSCKVSRAIFSKHIDRMLATK